MDIEEEPTLHNNNNDDNNNNNNNRNEPQLGRSSENVLDQQCMADRCETENTDCTKHPKRYLCQFLSDSEIDQRAASRAAKKSKLAKYKESESKYTNVEAVNLMNLLSNGPFNELFILFANVRLLFNYHTLGKTQGSFENEHGTRTDGALVLVFDSAQNGLSLSTEPRVSTTHKSSLKYVEDIPGALSECGPNHHQQDFPTVVFFNSKDEPSSICLGLMEGLVLMPPMGWCLDANIALFLSKSMIDYLGQHQMTIMSETLNLLLTSKECVVHQHNDDITSFGEFFLEIAIDANFMECLNCLCSIMPSSKLWHDLTDMSTLGLWDPQVAHHMENTKRQKVFYSKEIPLSKKPTMGILLNFMNMLKGSTADCASKTPNVSYNSEEYVVLKIQHPFDYHHYDWYRQESLVIRHMQVLHCNSI